MQPPFHRLEEFARLTLSDRHLIDGWESAMMTLPRRAVLRSEGDAVKGVFFLKKGWVSSSVLLRNGRRQIVKVHLPGDMLGFPSLSLQTAGETLEALSNVEVCPISNADLGRLLKESPDLAIGLFLSTQKERVALMQSLSWSGSASALERVVAFLLDLHDRASAAGLLSVNEVPLLLTQAQLAELLGITSIHVNRTLQELTRTQLIDRGRGWVRFNDLEQLRQLSPSLPPQYAGEQAWRRLGGGTNPQMRAVTVDDIGRSGASKSVFQPAGN